MNKEEFISLITGQRLYLVRKWINRAFMIIADTKSNPYIIRKSDGLYEATTNKLLDWVKPGEAVLHHQDIFTLKAGQYKCLKQDVETTVGRWLANGILIEFGLSAKLPYRNSEFTINDLEDDIKDLFVASPPEGEEPNNTNFYVSDLSRLSQGVRFIEQTAKVFTVSRDKYTLHPPKGIEEYSKKVLKEMEAKYGDKLWSEFIHSIEYDKKLMEFDDEYLKKSKTRNIVTNKKIKTQSRKAIYLSYGMEKNPFDKNAKPTMVTRPLGKGLELKEDLISVYWNDSRAGSYYRGVATQDSGATAKELIMATIGIVYVDGDCGSKEFKKVDIGKHKDMYIGRWYKDGNGLSEITKDSPIDNTTVEMRTIIFCKGEISKPCSVCAGTAVSKSPTGAVLQGTAVGGILVKSDMKKMHVSGGEIIRVEF